MRISFDKLHIPSPEGNESLSKLDPDDHIHGGLYLEIDDRRVPQMGFWGPDDVCLNAWLEELWLIANAFQSPTAGRHVFDEGEQGQPAFIFERIDAQAFLTIADSQYSEGTANPDWQRVEFSAEEFLAGHLRFRESFFNTLKTEAPCAADQWIQNHDPKARNT